MDDYMKEMMDLKTLVTKTLEKKGVLARIRAELRANVFQAIEEQDRVTEIEGGESFALLGQCSERAKQLHATPAGKLLTGLLCEYLEWCELERTLHVYLPELNQPKSYSRSELEELLEIKNDKNSAGGSADSRPLLLEVLEGYLKYELLFEIERMSKDNFEFLCAWKHGNEFHRNLRFTELKHSATTDVPLSSDLTQLGGFWAPMQTTLAKDSYASSKTSSKPSTNGFDVGDEDLIGTLESRLNLSK